MFQPQVVPTPVSNIVHLRPSQAEPGAGLSLRDRMEVARWQDSVHAAGYDRVVIHERSAFDPPEMECFLGLYRRGEPWARWGIARCGARVTAWCSVTGRDVGWFASMADALAAVLDCGARRLETNVIRAFA